ncbi:sulfur globule protein CV2 domain protein [Teladorsagia circumcincta]|uniref:Sulfur globule protein CV2 domain protein n=1 Tax=Teladorsagia circumcincta TaxID=45464 RepID=A0A2G9V4W1_TELCI|nr:sulfur globule protein CV2 domain protein [Teladorsagia circumcincta]
MANLVLTLLAVLAFACFVEAQWGMGYGYRPFGFGGYRPWGGYGGYGMGYGYRPMWRQPFYGGYGMPFGGYHPYGGGFGYGRPFFG